MRPLNVRYRHDVLCPYADCGKRVCVEGDISEALNSDGSPVSMPGFDVLKPHTFEITCDANHVISVHFPKDVMVVKSPDLQDGKPCPPAVLRV
jgi:hypothetical protein